MTRQQIDFAFLNVGHFFDHLFVLIFATVSALALAREWGMSYAELIPVATPGFVAFGVCALPAGWIADKWSREGMMAIFFIGIGASAVLTGQAGSPAALGAGPRLSPPPSLASISCARRAMSFFSAFIGGSAIGAVHSTAGSTRGAVMELG